jgi:hypothetical protein
VCLLASGDVRDGPQVERSGNLKATNNQTWKTSIIQRDWSLTQIPIALIESHTISCKCDLDKAEKPKKMLNLNALAEDTQDKDWHLPD